MLAPKDETPKNYMKKKKPSKYLSYFSIVALKIP